MLEEMEGAGHKLGDVLARRFKPMKEMYGRYCAGVPAAQELYEQKLQDKRFVKFEATMPELNKPTLNRFMRPFQVAVGGTRGRVP